jgi:hypothetical protein
MGSVHRRDGRHWKVISIDQGRFQVDVTYRHLSEHVLSPLQPVTHWVPHAWQM